MLARLGRAFLILAVLLAQQTALAHDFWHAGLPQGAENPKAPSSKGSKLCDLHDLLGTVLGALSGSAFEHELLSLSEVGFVAVATLAAELRPLSPRSRGPPLIS